MDAELLEILVCPETKQPLRLADEAFISGVNERIAQGSMTTRGGSPVTQPLSEALLREDGLRLYLVREGIPIMLLDEAIDLEETPATESPS